MLSRFFKWFLYPWLSEYRWFRKNQGGIWYKVIKNCQENGVQATYTSWERDAKDAAMIVDKEDYSLNKFRSPGRTNDY